MVKLLGSATSMRSRGGREGGRGGEEGGKVTRQLTKRFRWCFGPPEPPNLMMERRPLTLEDKGVPKQSSSSPVPTDPGLVECHSSTDDGTVKYSEGSDTSGSEAGVEVDLEGMEASAANCGVLLAECHRLRSQKRRLQQMLLDYDARMASLAAECDGIVAATNRRFAGAIRKVRYMDTVVTLLREELDNKVRSNTNLELERKVLRHELKEAVTELESVTGGDDTLARNLRE